MIDTADISSYALIPGRRCHKLLLFTFANVPEYPPADMKVVVRPNFDTLYSNCQKTADFSPLMNGCPERRGL